MLRGSRWLAATTTLFLVGALVPAPAHPQR